jgi:hypothetical protein
MVGSLNHLLLLIADVDVFLIHFNFSGLDNGDLGDVVLSFFLNTLEVRGSSSLGQVKL